MHPTTFGNGEYGKARVVVSIESKQIGGVAGCETMVMTLSFHSAKRASAASEVLSSANIVHACGGKDKSNRDVEVHGVPWRLHLGYCVIILRR